MRPAPHSGDSLLQGDVDESGLPLAVGTEARVWNHYLRRWTGGFTIAEVLADGYRLCRLSDGHVFSHVFSTLEVMEERRKFQEPGVQGTYLDRRTADHPDPHESGSDPQELPAT